MKLRFRTTGRRQTLALAVFTMVVTMLALGGGGAAAQGNIITRGTTINALSDATICTEDDDGTEVCRAVALHVSPNKEGTSIVVCVDVTTYTTEGESYEEGCADVAATFEMDTDELSWATLAPTAVELSRWVCNDRKECDIVYSRTVTLEVAWTATGELTPVKDTVGNPHGPCTVTDKIDGFVRDTAATLTVDGISARTVGNLQAFDWKTVRRTNCG